MNNSDNIAELHKIVNKDKIKQNIDIQRIENDLINMKRVNNHNVNEELDGILKSCKIQETHKTHKISENYNYEPLQEVLHNIADAKSESESESEEIEDDSNDEKYDNVISEKPIKKFKGEEFMNQYEKTGSPDFVSDYYGDTEIGNYKNRYNNEIRHEMYNLNKYNSQIDTKIEEEKELLMLDIEDMIDELTIEEINLSRIPEITDNMPIEVLRRIYKRVKRKYDRHRCEDLGKNVCIAFVRGLERVCNGRNRIFGLYPDLTGWHRTVRSKLSKLKYEQSTIVTNVMEKYKVGPLTRLMMELVPSAAIYSINKQDQRKMELQTNNSKNSKSELYDDIHNLYG